MKRIFVHPNTTVGATGGTAPYAPTQPWHASGQGGGSSSTSFDSAKIGNFLNGSADSMANSAMNGVADSIGNAIGGEAGQLTSTLMKEALNILKTFVMYNIGDGAKESAEELQQVQSDVSQMKTDAQNTLNNAQTIATNAESTAQEGQDNIQNNVDQIDTQVTKLDGDLEAANTENEALESEICDIQKEIEETQSYIQEKQQELSKYEEGTPEYEDIMKDINFAQECVGDLITQQNEKAGGIMANTEKISANAEGVFEVTQELVDGIDSYAKEITSVLGDSNAAINQMTNMLSSKFSGMDANTLVKLATEVTKAAVEGVESGILISAGTAMEGAAVVTMGATAEQGAEMIAKGGGKSADAIARGVTKMMGGIAEKMAKQAVSMTLNNIAKAIAPDNAELQNLITSVGDMAISTSMSAIENSKANTDAFLGKDETTATA